MQSGRFVLVCGHRYSANVLSISKQFLIKAPVERNLIRVLNGNFQTAINYSTDAQKNLTALTINRLLEKSTAHSICIIFQIRKGNKNRRMRSMNCKKTLSYL